MQLSQGWDQQRLEIDRRADRESNPRHLWERQLYWWTTKRSTGKRQTDRRVILRQCVPGTYHHKCACAWGGGAWGGGYTTDNAPLTNLKMRVYIDNNSNYCLGHRQANAVLASLEYLCVCVFCILLKLSLGDTRSCAAWTRTQHHLRRLFPCKWCCWLLSNVFMVNCIFASVESWNEGKERCPCGLKNHIQCSSSYRKWCHWAGLLRLVNISSGALLTLAD